MSTTTSAMQQFLGMPEMMEVLAEFLEPISIVCFRACSKRTYNACMNSIYIRRRLFLLPGKYAISGHDAMVACDDGSPDDQTQPPVTAGLVQQGPFASVTMPADAKLSLACDHPFHPDNINPLLHNIFGSFSVSVLSNKTVVFTAGKMPRVRRGGQPSYRPMYLSAAHLPRMQLVPAALYMPQNTEPTDDDSREQLEGLRRRGIVNFSEYTARPHGVHWTVFLATSRAEAADGWIWGDSLTDFCPGAKPNAHAMDGAIERDDGIQIYQLVREMQQAGWRSFAVTFDPAPPRDGSTLGVWGI